ncbi:XrtA/PEP-CTERM system-associated ATPase [Novosphingobium tardum]|uniref:XrtA/PEP-CTERM system-associated ATPase n=1 Tax=Novosphingobium tardum TaxID=1538021 RepID=A0ABV8RS05_9SPHN
MYDQFYGLTGRPFQLTPDPAFYFESATHRKALSYLGYGLAQAEGFMVITGEIGAGKSTLVAHLMQSIDRARLTAGQIVTSNLDGSELVHVAAAAFGLDVSGRDKASALGTIERFLQDEARAGRRCLLVVDEAQNLSIEALEELRMLSNFQLGAHPLLQILLLGQPEFRDLVAREPNLEQLRQRVIATHHLDAMSAAEVGPYIEHRLRLVGWSGTPSFEPGVHAQLAGESGGVPRRLNQLVHRLMLMAAVEGRRDIDLQMLDSVLADMAGDTPKMSQASEVQPAVVHAEVPVGIVAPEGASAAALAEQFELIRELQQAVVELAETQGPAAQPDASLARRLARLEAQIGEQEATIRHTLTMLIEWIESDDPHRAAA